MVAICASLYFFREQPICYDTSTISLESIRIIRVVDGIETDVTERINLAELVEVLSGIQSRRSIYSMNGYLMRDVLWEIDFIVDVQNPRHVVLGENNFWYISSGEPFGRFDIIDSDALISKVNMLYE